MINIDTILNPGLDEIRANEAKLAQMDAEISELDAKIAALKAEQATKPTLTYAYEYGGLLITTPKGDTYRLEDPKASRLYASARSMDALGCKPSGRRIMGRILNGWYGVTAVKIAELWVPEPTTNDLCNALRASLAA